MKKSITSLLISCLLTFVFTVGAKAQDTDSTKSKKAKVVLKLKLDEDGKATVIDTVFDLSDPRGQKEFEEAMKQYEGQMEKLEKKLKNLEVNVSIPDLPESLIKDSIFRYYKFDSKDLKCPRFIWDGKPFEFYYNFEDSDDFDIDIPSPDIRSFRFDRSEQTLSDLLGDIPMSRVKSYEIKDRKNGKRIVIDVEDGPIIKKGKKIMIIREPGSSHSRKKNPDRQKKVIIHSDDE